VPCGYGGLGGIEDSDRGLDDSEITWAEESARPATICPAMRATSSAGECWAMQAVPSHKRVTID
jgi:hypothetical protein